MCKDKNFQLTKHYSDLAFDLLKGSDVLRSEISTVFLGDTVILTIKAPINEADFTDAMQAKGLNIYLFEFSFLQSSYVIFLDQISTGIELDYAYQNYRFSGGTASFQKWLP